MAVKKRIGPGSDERFDYDAPAGHVSVPSLAKVKIGLLRKLRKLDEQELAFSMLESLCDEASLAVIDEMDADEFGEFMAAWQEFSGVSVGESSAS